jgi:protein tyrosine phosphatase
MSKQRWKHILVPRDRELLHIFQSYLGPPALPHLQGATVHTVSHYQYDTWPDKGVPQETASARILCHLIAAAQLAPGTPRVKPPTIIHCR